MSDKTDPTKPAPSDPTPDEVPDGTLLDDDQERDEALASMVRNVGEFPEGDIVGDVVTRSREVTPKG